MVSKASMLIHTNNQIHAQGWGSTSYITNKNIMHEYLSDHPNSFNQNKIASKIIKIIHKEDTRNPDTVSHSHYSYIILEFP